VKKIPPPEIFKELEKFFKKRGSDVLYIAGEADGWVFDYFHPVYKIEDLIKFSEDVKGASLYVGVDSGISHLHVLKWIF